MVGMDTAYTSEGGLAKSQSVADQFAETNERVKLFGLHLGFSFQLCRRFRLLQRERVDAGHSTSQSSLKKTSSYGELYSSFELIIERSPF